MELDNTGQDETDKKDSDTDSDKGQRRTSLLGQGRVIRAGATMAGEQRPKSAAAGKCFNAKDVTSLL